MNGIFQTIFLEGQTMQHERKFTIVIPTRERADTLIHTLASVLAQDYDNYEVLVSDNASNDNTLELVKGINSERIRYVNTGKRLSMSHSWEFALNHVQDGWVTILGDDDAIMPGALKRVNQIINETGTRAVRSNGCGYSWPSILGKKYGYLHLSLATGYRRVNSGSALSSVMTGQLPYEQLPMLYNGGFIDTSLIRQAKSITGSFYLSMTPDVYSGIVFALLTDEYIYSDDALAINGGSHHSGGTAAFEAIRRKRSYDPAEKYLSEGNIPFHKGLPLTDTGKPVLSIHALVYEAYLQATPFHVQKDKVAVSARQQLAIILKKAHPRHTEEVRNWGLSFAAQHKIDFDDNSHRANHGINTLMSNIFDAARTFRRLFSRLTFYGDRHIPLNNVYEASIVAGAIKSINPGFMYRFINACLRLKRRIQLKSSVTPSKQFNESDDAK